MPSNRLARDKGRQSWGYHELLEGTRPSLPGMQPGVFLPVAVVDKAHDDDPVVILPGTFVGRAPTVISGVPATFIANRPLIPACPTAYTVEYTAFDTTAAEFGGTVDLDGADLDAIATAGTSTQTLPITKPIGLVPQPVYSDVLSTRFNNYSRNMETTQILVQNQAVLIPAVTAREIAIDIGDKVCLDFTASPNYDPTNADGFIPGRIMDVEAATVIAVAGTSEAQIEAGIAAINEFTVGRCIDKFAIATQSSTSAGQTYRAALAAGNVDTSTVSTLWDFHAMRLVQTVPGLGLPGSGTEGVPGSLTFSSADANGVFWGLVIVVQVA